ncbi:MAG: pyridoxamine 5'-phosphate oxidase family protein, partial [Chloroflexi bacterium]|nr:pyridoxamine 5'-phosphate oxidase family protein [Chloroflexota bacterium]
MRRGARRRAAPRRLPPSVYPPREATPAGRMPPMATMTRDEAYAFIDSGPLWAILTTLGPRGYPHAVPLSYYRDGDDVFVNARGARLANMRRHPQVALLLESGAEMGELRGL